MPEVSPEVLSARREAAHARLERDLLLTLHQAEVSDVEVALLLVQRKLASRTDTAPEQADIESALREVLTERPHLRKNAAPATPALPGPLPVQAPRRLSVQAARQEALAKARTSRSPADLANYLRLRRQRA